ncbi:MAG TPA: periplasmic heavy metal sensor [Vicinamibacteria bacterium]|jgi:Spy/CpxP family protein refolding chaperone|nr:periplasmic heavy metal sensor [Vicinamibacteria bacterium]
MNSKSFGISILGVALAVTPVMAASAGAPADTGQSRGGERRLGRAADYLGLTADQQATWKSLFEQHKAEVEPLRQEHQQLHERLKAAMSAENPDATAVGEATLALKNHREKMKAAHTAFETRLASTLTPDQKTKFDAFKAAHHSHRHRGRRGGQKDGQPNPEAPGKPPAPVQG